MREIKFRGKRLDNGEWEYGSFILDWETKRVFFCHEWVPQAGWNSHEVDPETVGEYTGLKDKNGAEIYEGDVVKCVPYDGIEMLVELPDLTRDASFVEYLSGTFNLCQKYHGSEYIDKYLYMGEDVITFLEVIGNIHENPELLP